jgi:Flp pilus assembly pilin Flp
MAYNGQEASMAQLVQALWNDQAGQDLVEYVLIIILIALGVAIALTAFKNAITNAFNSASSTLNSQAGGS